MTPAISSSHTPTGERTVNNSHNGNGVPTASTAKSTPSINGSGTAKPSEAGTKRIDLERLVVEFQKKLGEKWDKYQSALCLFLLGKLSRDELTEELSSILDKQSARMHNQLLLANLANSLRDSPAVGLSSVGFGGPASKKQKRKTSSQYEKIKKDIMALPPRERRRLKNIQRDSGKKQMITSSLTMTRQELLPKIPAINKNNNNNNAGSPSMNGSSPDSRVNNTALWTQEILQGISTLNSSESYEIPDLDSLSTRMTAIMREHGLVGKINEDVTKIMLAGLETHLRSLMDSIIDVVRYRKKFYASDELLDTVDTSSSSSSSSSNPNKKNKKIVVTLEDMFDTFQQLPALIDVGGPSMRLSHSLLRNDDEANEFEGILKSKLAKLPSVASIKKEVAEPTGVAVSSPAVASVTASASTDAAPSADNNSRSVSTAGTETKVDLKQAENGSGGEEFGTKTELNMLLYDILAST